MAAKKVLTKIGETVSINIYDNGFMIEANGKDANNDWTTLKLVCNTTDELLTQLKAFVALERDE